MNGLVIKEIWADLILSGEKTWEIRSRVTHQRGTIAIIKSGSGLIYGTAELTDCIKLSKPNFEDNRDKHCIPVGEASEVVRDYKERFAWVLENVRKLQDPVPYSHPQGAIIWVRLSEDILEGAKPL
jgi:hypothetical protein